MVQTGFYSIQKENAVPEEPHGMARPAGFESPTPWFVAGQSNSTISFLFQLLKCFQLYYKISAGPRSNLLILFVMPSAYSTIIGIKKA